MALDFETTGLDLRGDAVVSFGLVPVLGGRVDLAGARYREVSPPVDPSRSSIRIHQLRPQDLRTLPRLEEVADELREGLAHRFLLAWAAEIEIAFLRRTFGGTARRWRARTIDVRTLAAAIEPLSSPGAGSLGGTAERFGIPVEQTHHALDDAFMTAELFLVMADRHGREGRRSIRSLQRVPARPYPA